MSQANDWDDPAKAPEIQDMIMSCQIGRIAAELARRLCVSPAEALLRFYESRTCAQLHDRETGLYLYGHLYIVDEYLLECGLLN